MTPMKAIRAKCLDCSCGSSNEVKKCPITKCPLYPYRTGHRPKCSDSSETPVKTALFSDDDSDEEIDEEESEDEKTSRSPASNAKQKGGNTFA